MGNLQGQIYLKKAILFLEAEVKKLLDLLDEDDDVQAVYYKEKWTRSYSVIFLKKCIIKGLFVKKILTKSLNKYLPYCILSPYLGYNIQYRQQKSCYNFRQNYLINKIQ